MRIGGARIRPRTWGLCLVIGLIIVASASIGVDSARAQKPSADTSENSLADELVGELTGHQILAAQPDLRAVMEEYEPDQAGLQRLADAGRDVTVLILFGAWCPACQRFLPNALRVERELAESGLEFRYYGLPQPPEGYRHPEALRRGVKVVPTALVYRGGVEIGRFSGPDGFRSVERQLLRVLDASLARR